jgi:hypothetical protein
MLFTECSLGQSFLVASKLGANRDQRRTTSSDK